MAPEAPRSKRWRLIDWLEARFNLTEIVSLFTSFGLFPTELDSTRPLRESIEEAFRKPVPSYARWPRVLGILSFSLFLFLGVTGVMLAFYYQPTPAEAYGSVTTIVRDVHFGWFVHQVHRWAAQILLLILLLRLVRFYFQGLYRSPREALWIVAVLTFALATHADLTGRLLLWDERGYWTTIRGLEILFALPVLGPMFSLIIGGRSVESLALTRFYILHIAILPAMLLALFYLHFSGVRRLGLSSLPGETRSGAAVYKGSLYNLLILFVLMLGGLVTLATLFPVTFGSPADLFVTPPDAHPPWYLLAFHAVIEAMPVFVPRGVRGFLVELIFLAVLLWPFLDRSTWQPAARRRFTIVLGIVFVVVALLLSWQGYRLEVHR